MRTLPRRCLHGVHPEVLELVIALLGFASALPARGASHRLSLLTGQSWPLPRRCLHGVHPSMQVPNMPGGALCLGAACTGCILHFIEHGERQLALPRRCLHGVHRQKPTNCGTPFCSIRRESVDSVSEINNKDSCADYFPALFCCQGDLHHHYRQPRTGNRPVLRCEQHRLFLFILSSHYRRLL